MGSLGMPEILMILVIALIIFGPRKLPELGKTLGQSLAQFRRASEDFKRQWEDEVELERRRIEYPAPAPVEASDESAAAAAVGEEVTISSGEPAHIAAANETPPAAAIESPLNTIGEPLTVPSETPVIAHHEEALNKETKRDWM